MGSIKAIAKNGIFLLVSVYVVVGISACAHECKSNPTPPPASAEAQPKGSIAAHAAEVFSSAPGLSAAQKEKVIEIYRRTFAEAERIRGEIAKEKRMLFETVALKSFKAKEIDLITKRIVALDQKRMTVMFQALKDVQAVIGFGPGKEDIYKHFYDFEYPKTDHISAIRVLDFTA